MSRQLCIVKVVINPTLPREYSLRFISAARPTLRVRLIVARVEDLPLLAAEMRETLPRFDYSLQFNWKNTPKAVVESIVFRDTMREIFANAAYLQERATANFTEQMRAYLRRSTSHPDFAKIDTARGRRAVVNYVRSALARPELPEDDVIAIARQLKASPAVD